MIQKNLFKDWARGEVRENIVTFMLENSKYEIIKSFMKSKHISIVGFIKTSYDVGNNIWKGNQHKIWQQIDKFYKKNLKGGKACESKRVYFCNELSFKRRGREGVFLPTGKVQLHLKKHKHF